MRSMVVLLGFLFVTATVGEEPATLTLRKGRYSLSVAGDGRVVRWTSALFTVGGLARGDRYVWGWTFEEKGDYDDGKLRLFETKSEETFSLSIWEEPGRRIRVTVLVFRAGGEVPDRGRVEACDARLDLEVRVVDGQSARAGDLHARLLEDPTRLRCLHAVELENAGDSPIACTLRIVPDRPRRPRAEISVTVPAAAKRTVRLDGKLPPGARWHACRIEIRPRGRRENLVLWTRPWISPHGHVSGDPPPPPPPDAK